MSRYIEEEAIIKAIDESGHRYGMTTANQCNFKEIVRKTPTADVVPKSEVENYKKISQQQQTVSMDRYFEIKRLKEEREKAKQAVAIEIFAEIEVIIRKYDECPKYQLMIDLAELKNKYMGAT